MNLAAQMKKTPFNLTVTDRNKFGAVYWFLGLTNNCLLKWYLALD